MSEELVVDKRKILHVDMDAFYASVEILDNPELKGKAVIIGGDPNSRGVVSTASYEARQFGVHSAMATAQAKKLCPHGIFVRPRHSRYKEISGQIHTIFSDYSDVIEALALDEAWLDVTENPKGIASATHVAKYIQQDIYRTLGLTCSAGVSFNKFLAKVASDENKPNGIFVIPPQKAHDFMMTMPVKKIPGVGKVTAKHMTELGLTNGKDLFECTEAFLAENFGKFGYGLYKLIRGIDLRPVSSHRERKSISAENTFSQDLLYGEKLLEKLKAVTEELWSRCGKKSIKGKTLTLKIKFEDFHQITRSVSTESSFESSEMIWELCLEKIKVVCLEEFPNKPIRLLGIGISNLENESSSRHTQLDFFHLL